MPISIKKNPRSRCLREKSIFKEEKLPKNQFLNMRFQIKPSRRFLEIRHGKRSTWAGFYLLKEYLKGILYPNFFP